MNINPDYYQQLPIDWSSLYETRRLAIHAFGFFLFCFVSLFCFVCFLDPPKGAVKLHVP